MVGGKCVGVGGSVLARVGRVAAGIHLGRLLVLPSLVVLGVVVPVG